MFLARLRCLADYRTEKGPYRKRAVLKMALLESPESYCLNKIGFGLMRFGKIRHLQSRFLSTPVHDPASADRPRSVPLPVTWQ